MDQGIRDYSVGSGGGNMLSAAKWKVREKAK